MSQLRHPGAFETGFDVVARLVAEPAVAMVAAESGDGGVTVSDREGEGTISWNEGRIRYEPGSGDPLRIGAGAEGTDREWLTRTWDSAMPDAAFQLLDQFRASRTGDLVVMGREGYDFRERFEIPEHRSGHGSLIRAHMHTPLWSNRRITDTKLRTIDLFPTMLTWMGTAVPEGIDGEHVWEVGR